MQSKWKKYLWRHGLFTYSRDSMLFFVNLYLWSQVKDLQIIALFNITYLAAHTSMFVIGLPIAKADKSQTLMRAGLAGLALVMAAVTVLGDRIVDHIYVLGLAYGLANGAYWFVNHIQSLDISDTKNRASFLSYRNAVQVTAKLAVPAVGFVVFTLLANDTTAYTVIFGMAMLAMIGAWFFVDITSQIEEKLDVRGSLKAFNETPHFWMKMWNGFFFGLTLKSALATIVLPFLIFQIVTKESSLSIIQTAVEVAALVATFYFAGHKKNTEYIHRLLYIGGTLTAVGLVLLLARLNIHTYIAFVITYVLSLSATSIAAGTMSNNYVTKIHEYRKHRIEFIVVREVFALSGFITGYVFVYFFNDLSITSLRPLLIAMIAGTLISLAMSIKLWRFVQSAE